MRVMFSALFMLALLAFCAPASAAMRKTVTFEAAAPAALNVDRVMVSDVEIESAQINLSQAVEASVPIYFRRLSAGGAVLAEYAVDPSDVSATRYTIVFGKFLLQSGETLAIDWAGDGVASITAGSNIVYTVQP